MHEIFKHDGEDFSCIFQGSRLQGRIKIEGNSAFFCQDVMSGTPPSDRLGYRYGWVYIQYNEGGKTYQTEDVENLIYGSAAFDSPIPLDIKSEAQLKAKELLPNSTDEEIDAFINGWELGIEWFKKQNNIK